MKKFNNTLIQLQKMSMDTYSKRFQFYEKNIPCLLLKYIKSIEWKSCLDLGCGDGSLLYALDLNGYLNNKKVYAIDISDSRLNLVRKIDDKFRCFVNDACDMKNIGDGSIDFLFTTQLIEHVSDDEKMIKEIHRVLRKNGYVYLSTVFKKWYGWYFYRCNGKWVLDPTHLREYTEDNQLFEIFRKYDFELIESKKSLIWRPLLDFILRRLIFKIMKPKRNIYENRFLKMLRNFKVPLLGYYHWEIVCRKE